MSEAQAVSVTRLIEHFNAEHDLIERMVVSFRAYVERRIARAAGPEDARAFLTFFREFAGAWHQAREESVLFAALVRNAGVPAGAGPLAVLHREHGWLRAALERMEPLLIAETNDPAEIASLRWTAETWSHTLWQHIDAERSVLFPESRLRLARTGTLELDELLPSAAQRDSRDEAIELLDRYPRFLDWYIVRGDGCIFCTSFGVRCDGIEREWWSEADHGG